MATFTYINERKYLCWTVEEYIEQFKEFHQVRTVTFMVTLAGRGLALDEIEKQIKSCSGEIYNEFLVFNNVGGNTFYQETHVALSLIGFVGRDICSGVCFPVKNDCPQDISLADLEAHLEDDSGYDCVLKSGDGDTYYQIKSVDESRPNGEFTAENFLKKIQASLNKYRDEKMILTYLLRPSQPRNSYDEFYTMMEEVSHALDDNLTVKDIIFLARKDLENYQLIKVYKELVIEEIKVEDSMQAVVRNI